MLSRPPSLLKPRYLLKPKLSKKVLEGTLLRANSGNVGGQSNASDSPRRHLRWQPAAYKVSLPGSQDASNTAGEGDHRGIYQKRGLQVSEINNP